MKTLEEVKRELERIKDLVADKKKQVKRIEEALILLGSTEEDLQNELDDLCSKLTYYYQKEKDLS